MITGELKNKIDGLWDIFAAGGLVNPLDVIEQITYLMFIRDLDDTDNKRSRESVMLMLSKVVDCLDNIYTQMSQVQDTDIRGNVHEYLLSKISQSGRNGQFRTPRHIIRMMVGLMAPRPDDVICDPAC